jgi:hypothetical protein
MMSDGYHDNPYACLRPAKEAEEKRLAEEDANLKLFDRWMPRVSEGDAWNFDEETMLRVFRKLEELEQEMDWLKSETEKTAQCCSDLQSKVDRLQGLMEGDH